MVCQCHKLATQDILTSLHVLERDDAARFVRWWVQHSVKFPDNAEQTGHSLKETIRFHALPVVNKRGTRRPLLIHPQTSSKIKKEQTGSSKKMNRFVTCPIHPVLQHHSRQNISHAQHGPGPRFTPEHWGDLLFIYIR